MKKTILFLAVAFLCCFADNLMNVNTPQNGDVIEFQGQYYRLTNAHEFSREMWLEDRITFENLQRNAKPLNPITDAE